MNPMPSTPLGFGLHWSARVLSFLSLAVLLLFMVGEGFNPFHLKGRELALAVFFPLGVMLGLGLAWRWQAFGGALTVGCLAAFYLVHRLGAGRWPGGWAFGVLALPGVLFLLAALVGGRKTRGEIP
jgi:hypothetical protein